MCEKLWDKGHRLIKDFSKAVGISAAMLRYYDQAGIFPPAERDENGYRLYSDEQLTTAKSLRVYTDIGLGSKEIKRIIRGRTPKKQLNMLLRHRDSVLAKSQSMREALDIIDVYAGLLREAVCLASEAEIFECEMPDQPIILGGVNDFDGKEDFIQEFTRFCHAQRRPGLHTSYPVGGYFDSMDAFKKTPSRPTRFFALNPNGFDRRESGLYLIAYTHGYYGNTGDLVQRLASYAKENGYIFDGPVYNIYLTDEISEREPDKYLLKAFAAVKNAPRPSSRDPLDLA